VRDRWASRIPLYTLGADADTWLHHGADGALPQVVCRLSPDHPLRFAVRPSGRVWFSAWLGADGEGKARGTPVGVRLAVRDARGQRSWSSTTARPPTRLARRGTGTREWRVFLGRFRGELIEITLECDGGTAHPAAEPAVAVRDPSLHTAPSPVALAGLVARRCWRTLLRDGVPGLLSEAASLLDAERGRELRYRYWIRRHGRARRRVGRTGRALVPPPPGPALVIPVDAATSRDGIGRLLDSLSAQDAVAWEALAVVGAEIAADVRTALRERAAIDPRIRMIDAPAGADDARDGLAAALNLAVASATGPFLALLSPDGELAPEALSILAEEIERHPRADVLYSDEDRIDARGRRHRPFFKPGWSPHYFRSYAYLGQICVYRRDLVRAVGGFRPSPAGAEDYDLLLRLVDRAREIRHMPAVLWHSSSPDAAPLPLARGAAGDLAVLRHHLAREPGAPEPAPGLLPGTHRVRGNVRGAPVVSVIIPTRDRVHLLRRCLAGLRDRTAYRNLDVVVVDNGSIEPETEAFLASCLARVVRSNGPFNFSRLCHAGARHARGRHLLFLNNDTEPMSDDWLGAMLELSEQEDVGAVGAKLHYPDGRVQHVGIAVGINGTAAQIFRGAAPDHAGYFGRALTIHECAAVTGACLMTRRGVWEAVGGFDETFPDDYNDVDYCLRLARHGYRVVFTPFARLLHHEFASRTQRPRPAEVRRFRDRWADAVDPYYSRNLSLHHTDCSVQLTLDRARRSGRA
jgi:GT2 family glycosyltransferase